MLPRLSHSAADNQPTVPDDSSPTKLNLPLIGVDFEPPAQTSDQAVSSDSLPFTSRYWRLSFHYPIDWQVVEPDPSQFSQPDDNPDVKGYGYGLRLMPIGASTKTYIGINNYDEQLSPGQSLEDFVPKKVTHEGLILEFKRILTDTQTLVLTTESGQSLELFLGTIEMEVSDRTIYTRLVWFTSGRIVYVIWSSDPTQFVILETIAKSMRFSSDAPTTLGELFGENVDDLILTVEQKLEFWTPKPNPDYCDLPCRDRKAQEEQADTTATSTPVPSSTPVPDGAETDVGADDVARPVAVASATPASASLALPPNWFIPTRSNTVVNCGSTFHTGNAQDALDISVGIENNVYAAKNGTITDTGVQPGVGTYGAYIVINTTVYIANESRQYIHGYAHLSNRNFLTPGVGVSAGTIIGLSGDSGLDYSIPGTGPHLHFHISRLDGDRGPVDASPLIGFTPSEYYPNQYHTCGKVVQSIPNSSYPQIIDAAGFSARYSRGGYSWFCYTGGNTAECVLQANPDNETVWTHSVPTSDFANTPQVVYDIYAPVTGNYYVWGCGKGGYQDNSVHIASSSVLALASSRE